MEFKEIADALDKAERMGNVVDDPEGTKYIVLSDTLASIISDSLRGYGDD